MSLGEAREKPGWMDRSKETKDLKDNGTHFDRDFFRSGRRKKKKAAEGELEERTRMVREPLAQLNLLTLR